MMHFHNVPLGLWSLGASLFENCGISGGGPLADGFPPLNGTYIKPSEYVTHSANQSRGCLLNDLVLTMTLDFKGVVTKDVDKVHLHFLAK